MSAAFGEKTSELCRRGGLKFIANHYFGNRTAGPTYCSAYGKSNADTFSFLSQFSLNKVFIPVLSYYFLDEEM